MPRGKDKGDPNKSQTKTVPKKDKSKTKTDKKPRY